MNMQDKRFYVIILITAILLLIPLIAMQFTEEINWTWFDFVVAAILLIGAGSLCSFFLTIFRKNKYRIPIIIIILILFVLIWAELAVGIFDT
ncbi:MAG: hypothetical protein U9P73_10990 [Candidatus Cloacimonadota bacterium]|nr:hypothetical protein [Candidatus Cloacimonadota bacterium]